MWRALPMKEYDKKIVNELLDAYERSSLYKGKSERSISISFRFTSANLPEYFDQTSSIYEDIHGYMRKLEEMSLIRIIWKNNRPNHVITKVVLIHENVDQAYKYVKRQSRTSKEQKCEDILDNYIDRNETLINFCNWANRQMKMGLSVKRFFDIHNTKDLIELLDGVEAVTNNMDDYYIRELSILIYNDSKKLEALRARIEALIKEFHPSRESFSQSYDILGEFNISRNPVWIMLKGVGCLHLKNSIVQLLDFEQGIGLSGSELLNIKIKRDVEVKRVITVENLTAFHRLHCEASLVIYLAGFHNRARRELLERVYEAYGQATYYHWGDIDVGGFRIYFDLCLKTGIPFRMLWMDADTLIKYKDFAKRLTANDKRELNRMLEREECSEKLLVNISEFKHVVNTMLSLDIKLEQEIVHEELY